MNVSRLPNQTRATSGARKREDPCLPFAISAVLWPSPGLFSGPVNADTFMGTVSFVLSFTDKAGLCCSLPVVELDCRRTETAAQQWGQCGRDLQPTARCSSF